MHRIQTVLQQPSSQAYIGQQLQCSSWLVPLPQQIHSIGGLHVCGAQLLYKLVPVEGITKGQAVVNAVVKHHRDGSCEEAVKEGATGGAVSWWLEAIPVWGEGGVVTGYVCMCGSMEAAYLLCVWISTAANCLHRRFDGVYVENQKKCTVVSIP